MNESALGNDPGERLGHVWDLGVCHELGDTLFCTCKEPQLTCPKRGATLARAAAEKVFALQVYRRCVDASAVGGARKLLLCFLWWSPPDEEFFTFVPFYLFVFPLAMSHHRSGGRYVCAACKKGLKIN
jgi:hypothetical protein